MSGHPFMDRSQPQRVRSMALHFLRSRRLQGDPFSAKSDATRILCSSRTISSNTYQDEGPVTPSVSIRRSGAHHLTRLFGRFLRSGDDRKAAETLNEVRVLDGRAGVAVCNHLLNSCSKSRNSEMAKHVWSVMKENGVQMNEVSFGNMLSALTRGGCLDEAVDLLQVLHRRTMANVVMYNIVLNGCAHAQSKAYAARCVQWMDAQGVAKDEMTYVELIKISGVQGDVYAAKKWWAELLENHVPSPLARAPYIIALCRTNQLKEAQQELQQLVADAGLRAQLVRSESLTPHQPSEDPGILLGSRQNDDSKLRDSGPGEVNSSESSSSHNVEGATEESSQPLSTELKEQDSSSNTSAASSSVRPTQVALAGEGIPKKSALILRYVHNAYNSLINAAGKTGDITLAEKLFEEMRSVGLKTDIYTHNALLRAVVDGKGVQPALQIVKDMEFLGLQPDTHSYTALLEGYCRTQQLNKAEAMLNYMESGRRSQLATCRTFNILLEACAAQGDSRRALRLFARMRDAGVAPDGCTYLALLSACGNAKGGTDGNNKTWSGQEVVRRVTAIEVDMVRSGVPHTPETFTAVLNVLGGEGLTAEMLQRLEDADKHLLDASAFNTVILHCLNAKQLETAWEIYEQMKSSGVKASLYTYNILINGCSQDKSVSTARKLLDTMRDKGLPPDVVTYNSLLKVVCRNGQMDALPELLQRMAADGVECDLTTFNTILTSASYQRRIDVTEHVIEEMQRRMIWPDLHTLLSVITAYMRVGQNDDAVEALRILSLRMLDREKHLQQQRNEEDDDASAAADGPELHEFDQTPRSEGYQAVGNPGREEDEMRDLLKNAMLHATPASIAKYTAVLATSFSDANDSCGTEHNSWAARLSRQYDRHESPFNSKMQAVKP